MADAIELEEMVVRFTADQTKYVQQVKEVQKVTQEAVVTAEKAAKAYQKAIPVAMPLAQRAAKEAQSSSGLTQDSGGNWRNVRGQYASAAELKVAIRTVGEGTVEGEKYARALDKVSSSLGGATKHQKQYARSVSETSQEQSGFSQFAGRAAGFAAPVMAGMGIGGLASMVTQGVQLAAQAESVEITFQTIIGDIQKADTVLTELRAFADWSPFNTGEVMEAGKMMLAMGTSADQVVNVMMTMGDVAGALNIPIKDLTYLMGTLQSVGRATTVDLNQFALRGIPIWRELAEMMYGDPKAVDKVRKAVEAGQISFDIVDKAFKKMTGAGGMFYKGMEKQATGLSGLWATFQSETENTLKAFGKEIIDNLDLKWVLNQVTDLTKWFTKMFNTLNPETKRFIIFTIAAAAGVMVIVGTVIILGTVFNTMFGGLGIMIGLLVVGASLLAGWAASTGKVQDVWRELVYSAKKFWDWVKPIAPLILAVVGVMFPFVGVVMLLVMYWKEVTAAVSQFFKYADPILRELKYTIINIATAVRDGLVRAWEWAAEKLKEVISRINDLWGQMGTNIDWSSIQDGLRELIVFVEFAFMRMDLVADVAWKAIRYGAAKLVNDLMKNIFYVMAVMLFPPILLGMLVNWDELLSAMLHAAVAFGVKFTGFMTTVLPAALASLGVVMADMWEKLLNPLTAAGELLKMKDKLGEAVKGAMAGAVKAGMAVGKIEVTTNFSGVKIEGLQKLEDQTKRELDESMKRLTGGHQEFKDVRKAKIFFDTLAEIGKEAFKAGLQPFKGDAENVGKQAGEALGNGVGEGMKKGMGNADAILRGSLADAVRTQEYLEYLDGIKGKKFNPTNLPPGAVSPDQWKPPVQPVGPMGANQVDRDRVVDLLGLIAGSLSKIESKPPALTGGAGL